MHEVSPLRDVHLAWAMLSPERHPDFVLLQQGLLHILYNLPRESERKTDEFTLFPCHLRFFQHIVEKNVSSRGNQPFGGNGIKFTRLK